MDERRNATTHSSRRWLRIAGESVAVLVVLLCILHRPILLSVGRAAARHFAAKANLSLDCRLEGSVFSNLVVRNLHIAPTGPTIIESADVDYVRADYNLLDFVRSGASEFLKNVEVRGANVVLNPATAAVKAKVPANQPLTLPQIFPYRAHLSDVNVVFRSAPQDFVLQGFELDLNANAPGELRMAKLQLPMTPAWTNVAAKTSYTNRKLVISDLALDANDSFRTLVIDASRIRDKSLGVVLDASLAGGTISGNATVTQVPRSLDARVHVAIDNVSLDTVRGYIGRREGELTGTVQRVLVDFAGVLDTPKSWNATVAGNIKDLKQGAIAFNACSLAITARDGAARVDLAELSQGPNTIKLRGGAELPADIDDFGRSPATFDVNAMLPDLHSATAMLNPPISGAGNVSGNIQISNAQIAADLNFNGGDIAIGRGILGKVTGTLHATKQMPPAHANAPYFAGVKTESHVTATELRAGEWSVDRAEVNATSVDDLVTFEDTETVHARNTLALRGDYRLPADFAMAHLQPAHLSVQFSAVNLADFFPADSPNRITGPLQLSGSLTMTNGVADGQLQLFGDNIRARDLTVPMISSDVTIARNVVYLNDVTVKLNDRNSLGANGTFEIQQPYRYSGNLSVNIADLATLQPLLAMSGSNAPLGGALAIDWQGNGTAADFKNSGKLNVNLNGGRYANMQALQAKIDASYTPEALDVPVVFFASDKMSLQASMSAKGETLEVSNIELDQGQSKYAGGYISLPFVWSNLGSDQPLAPDNGKVAISFQSENLDIKKLFDDLGQKPLGTGLLNVKVDAKGTLANLSGRVDVQARDLRAQMQPKLEPATFNVAATLQNTVLAVNGRIEQPKVQPVELTANLPLNIANIVREKRFDENTPVQAKVQMPRSSVNFVRQFVPAINQLDGDAALDVNVGGTIAKPVLSGTADLNVNVARFENPTLPALTAFKSHLTFDRDVLNFGTFEGQLAGGTFRVGGRITLPKLTEPTFDLQLKADSVLVARNDTLTARADADIRVSGPIAGASVAGNVALTNSHLLKNLDLIPIGLPGRPAPQPPEEHATLTFPQPPIRDWKFDVNVTTKDPFQIRGNLATGGAIVNMHLGGTGLQPLVQGQVRLENVEATLPFSRLEIDSGYLHFNSDDPFNPSIDVRGTSVIRDYTVHVNVYGTAQQPEAVFTSEPPLPQEEIISLLATGTTREELTGNNNVLAGKAAMLLFTQLYRKIFKKSGDAPPSNSVFNRLQVDVGSVDPRTGQQTASARFKASEHFVLLGQIEVGGDFRGQVQYVLRFR